MISETAKIRPRDNLNVLWIEVNTQGVQLYGTTGGSPANLQNDRKTFVFLYQIGQCCVLKSVAFSLSHDSFSNPKIQTKRL